MIIANQNKAVIKIDLGTVINIRIEVDVYLVLLQDKDGIYKQ